MSIPDDNIEAGFSLQSTAREGHPQFRAFAELVLDFLHGAGLLEMDKVRRAPHGNNVAPDPKLTQVLTIPIYAGLRWRMARQYMYT